MNAERWQMTKDALERALECDAAERAAFLEDVGRRDPELRAEVESLLTAGSPDDSFLEVPAVAPGVAARIADTGAAGERAQERIVGEVVEGKYRIEEVRGRGGMGTVYRATHLGTGRAVAVKVVAPEFMANEEFVERFKREAKAAGRLRHPNVVFVTDFGFAMVGSRRAAYLVMEYLDGTTLGDLIRKEGPLPVDVVVDVMEQACLAVEEAHRQGILHRDLKPDNIWLEPTGRGGYNVKVLDFGLAKLREAAPTAAARATQAEPLPVRVLPNVTQPTLLQPESVVRRPSSVVRASNVEPTGKSVTDGPRTSDNGQRTVPSIDARTVPQGLTRVGMVLGTPLYMSPEQCRSERIEPASDVYSLGVVAYEMLAGKPPFSGNADEMLVKHSEMAPPRLRDARRSVPRPLEAVVMAALAKVPSDRPPTAAAFAVAMRAAVQGEEQVAREARHLSQSHVLAFRRIAVAAHLPFLLAVSLLVSTMVRPWEVDVPVAWAVHPLCWIVAFALVQIAAECATAAYALAAESAQEAPLGPLPITSIVNAASRRVGAIAAATVRGLLRPSSVFAGPALLAEKTSVSDALTRSRTLSNRLPSLASAMRVRQIGSGIALLLGALLLSTVFDQWFAALSPKSYFREIIPFTLTFFILALVTVFALPKNEIAIALLYFRARRANGEEDGRDVVPAASSGAIPLRPRALRWRTPRLVASAAVLGLTLGTAHILFVPPVAPAREFPVSPVQAPVPYYQNAWVDYAEAIRSLEFHDRGIASLRRDEPLNDFAMGKTDSLPEDIALLVVGEPGDDGFLAPLMYGHIIKGSRRPFAQHTVELDPHRSEIPSLLHARKLANLAAARARYLAEMGREHEAAELLTATYRFASDYSEPSMGLIGALISTSARRTVEQATLAWLARGGADAAIEIELARQLARADERMPDLVTVIENTLSAWKSDSERILIAEPHDRGDRFFGGGVVGLLRFTPGVRYRTYDSIARERARLSEELGPGLERWNLSDLFEAQQLAWARIQSPARLLRPGDAVTTHFFTVALPSIIAVTHPLYEDRATGIALRALLVLDAYHKTHAKYPESIEQACAELGVPIPIDPTTRATVRYRIENGEAVVWLAGPDGRDDGGTTPYVPTPKDEVFGDRIQTGTDMIFRIEGR
jgi:serine/threonine protein kinase